MPTISLGVTWVGPISCDEKFIPLARIVSKKSFRNDSDLVRRVTIRHCSWSQKHSFLTILSHIRRMSSCWALMGSPMLPNAYVLAIWLYDQHLNVKNIVFDIDRWPLWPKNRDFTPKQPTPRKTMVEWDRGSLMTQCGLILLTNDVTYIFYHFDAYSITQSWKNFHL